jgi:hypothetical protein
MTVNSGYGSLRLVKRTRNGHPRVQKLELKLKRRQQQMDRMLEFGSLGAYLFICGTVPEEHGTVAAAGSERPAIP